MERVKRLLRPGVEKRADEGTVVAIHDGQHIRGGHSVDE